jgi:hypothetical protein
MRLIMENNETYFVARLFKRAKDSSVEFLSSDIFETIEEARIWGMAKAKLLVSDNFLRTCKVDDVVLEIDKHFFGYEISSEELLKNSVRVS